MNKPCFTVLLTAGLLGLLAASVSAQQRVALVIGHGIEVDQRNFLVPVDAKLASDQDVEFETVPLELVMRSVSRASGFRLVILDACRDNPFAVSMQRAGETPLCGSRLGTGGACGRDAGGVRGERGYGGVGRRGPQQSVQRRLLANLEEPGLEVGLLFRKVRDAVLTKTGGRQEPFVYGSLSSRGTYLATRAESELPPSSPAPPVGDGSASERLTAEQLATERLFWESVKDSTNPADIRAYLDHYHPGGTYKVLAQNRLRALQGAAAPVVESPAQEWEKLGLVMVRVDGGSFIMGCQRGRDSGCGEDNEKPPHQVQVRGFEIGK